MSEGVPDEALQSEVKVLLKREHGEELISQSHTTGVAGVVRAEGKDEVVKEDAIEATTPPQLPTSSKGHRVKQVTIKGRSSLVVGNQTVVHKYYGRPRHSRQHYPDVEPHFFVFKPLSVHFTGRSEHLQTIKEYLFGPECRRIRHHDRHKIVVIQGMGGSGKTQLALKYAYSMREHYWGIFWIDASSRANAQNNLEEIGNIGHYGRSANAVLHWLSTKTEKNWLLVLDNADEPDKDLFAIEDLMPPGNCGHVIITTRNPDMADEFATVGSIHLREMGRNEAIDLLLQCASSDDDLLNDEYQRHLADEIATNILYRLAKCIDAAGRFIRQKKYTLERYLQHYLPIQKKRESQSKIDPAEMAVQTAWEAPMRVIEHRAHAFKDLWQRQKYRDAMALFNVLLFFHYDGVSVRFFYDLWSAPKAPSCVNEHVPEIFSSGHKDTIGLQERLAEAMRVLYEFAIIECYNLDDSPGNFNKSAYAFHPLVQTSARHKLRIKSNAAGKPHPYLKIALHVLASSIPKEQEDIDPTQARRLIPHIRECITLVKELDRSDTQDTCDTHFKASDFTTTRGLMDTEVGAIQYERFANVYGAVAWWKTSAELCNRALLYRQSVCGRHDEATLVLQRKISLNLFWECDLEQCIRIQIRLLVERWRKRDSWLDWIFAPVAPNCASYFIALSDLTQSLWQAHKTSVAVRTGECAVRGLERCLKDDDLRLLTAKLNLGRVYNHNDCSKEAHGLLVDVVRARKRLLRPQHCDLMTSVPSKQRRPQAPGYKHIDTLLARNELAFSLRDKPYRERIVEQISRNVVRDAQECLGEEHPFTLVALSDLAKHLSTMNRKPAGGTHPKHQEAIDIIEEVMLKAHRTFREHRFMLCLLKGMQGRAYARDEQWSRALEVLQELLEQTQPSEPHYFILAAACARLQFRARNYEDAEKLLMELIAMRALKKDHDAMKDPGLVNVLTQQAVLYKHTGQADKLSALKSRYPGIDENSPIGSMYDNFNAQMLEFADPIKAVYDVIMFLWASKEKHGCEAKLYDALKWVGDRRYGCTGNDGGKTA